LNFWRAYLSKTKLRWIIRIALFIFVLRFYYVYWNDLYGKIGMASYYSYPFHGRKTASGRVYNKYKLTAAHRTLAFKTKVKVTNLKNDRTVVVTINDRGPFIRGRIIDLSWEAARRLGMLKKGISKVKLEIID